jgi:hypothetical protein
MSDRPQLLTFWRTRLAANQNEIARGSPHLQWLRRAYIRVYRFLLSQYGEVQENAAAHFDSDCDDIAGVPVITDTSNMPLVDNTPDHRGRPPKTIGKIQNVLKGIHNANDRDDEPGPLAQGLPGTIWLTVAARRERWIPEKCVRFLQQRGIPARKAARSDDVVVEVARKDFQAAAYLLHAARPYLIATKSPLRPVWRLSFGALSGGFVGMITGSMFALFYLYHGGDAATAVAIFVLGSLAGFFLGVILGFASFLSQLGVRRHPTSDSRNHLPP